MSTTPSLIINGVRWLSSRRWTWKLATKFGWRFVHWRGRLWMTTVPTWLILRVSCWRRKLWPHFDDFVLIIRKIIFNYNRKKKLFCEIDGGNDLKYQIESKVAKGWVIFDEIWTVDVNWFKEYTIKCSWVYLLKMCETWEAKNWNWLSDL